MITKNKLEELAAKYEIEEFVKNDPIQFPRRFSDEKDVEIAGFLASLFAYGSRKVFIKKLDELFKIMDNKPLEFVLNFDSQSRVGLLSHRQKNLAGFNYRFAKDFDVIEIFIILKKLYSGGSGLKELFEYGYSAPRPNPPPQGVSNSILLMLQAVTDYFYSNVQNDVGQGFYHMIPNPKNGGAMKRMNMFLRWMVRKGPVDLGVWNFIPTSELLIPLDVHVARLSREMGLLKRTSNDFKAVLELSENLKNFCPSDPVKFDFAIFGLGVNQG